MSRRASSGRDSLFVLGLVLLAAFALFGAALGFPYLLDDAQVVEAHPDVLEPEGLLRLWGHHYWEGVSEADPNLYRPLAILSFHLNARTTGLAPPWVRGTNVLVLAALALVVFRWLRAWGVRPGVAGAAALAFLAHPLQVAVVDYVVGRADLQMLLGVVGFLVLQRRAQLAGRWSSPRLALGLACAALAVGSKESGILLLPLAALQALAAGGTPDRARVFRASVAASVVPLLVYFAARAAVVGAGRPYGPGYAYDPLKNPLVGLSLSERLPAAFSIVAFHAKQLFLPDPSFWHVPDVLPVWTDASTLAGVGVAVLGGGALLWAIVRRSPLAIPLGLAAGQLAIASQVARPLALYAADRLAGPVLLGAVLVVAWLVDRSAEWLDGGRARGLGVVGGAVCALLLALEGLGVHRAHAGWRSGVARAALDLERHPDELDSITAYAHATFEAGRYEEAARYARESVARKPEFPGTRLVLGTSLLALGDRAGARRELARVVEATRDAPVGRSFRARALVNLAGLELEAGDLEAGRRHLLEAETIWPADFNVLVNLALLARREGDTLERLRRLRQITEAHPGRAEELAGELDDVADALRSEARAHARSGRTEPALERYGLVLELRPGDPQALHDRGLVLLSEGRTEEAVADWEAALGALAPEDSLAETLRNRLDDLREQRE